MKKKLVAASAIAALALSMGSVASASAHDKMGSKGNGLTGILGGLVTKGTLTQAQVDAITKAMNDVRDTAKTAHDAARAEHIKVITDTLEITEGTLKSRLEAGDSLATIAGAKKDALITALVAFETKQIDAAVTAGKLTAERATEMKSKLKDFVTKMVERKQGMGKGPKGIGGPKGPGDFMGKGHGRGGH
jgi:polyhydroxyalkanoate synthesis regulator phasin